MILIGILAVAGAAVLAAYLLLTHGAPPLAVAAGIGGAAIFLGRTSRTV